MRMPCERIWLPDIVLYNKYKQLIFYYSLCLAIISYVTVSKVDLSPIYTCLCH